MTYRFKKFVLLLGDFAALNTALVLTVLIRYEKEVFATRWYEHAPHFLIISFIWLLIIYINGLYSLNLKVSSRRFFRQIANTTILSTLLSIFYFYLNFQTSITPRTNLAIFIVVFLVIFWLWRAFYSAMVHAVIPKANLAIIGFNARTEKLVEELKNNPGAGYEAALIFKSSEELIDLPATIKEKNIHAIVVCDDFGQSENLREALFSCLAYNLVFFNYPDFYELLTEKVPVEAIGPDWFFENLKEGQKNYFNFVKRLADFILALIIFIISLPFWPLFALLIKATSSGPVFFTQIRYGRNEKTFKMIKFRTMRVSDNNLAPTEVNDNRITALGSFLRKTRLDEIPQVINILKSDMSFIGPRPERPEIVADLEHKIPFYKTRLLIKPGLTGWDQISGHYHSPSLEDSLEKLQYDLYYLKHRSLYLDLSIALRTIATMMSSSGR